MSKLTRLTVALALGLTLALVLTGALTSMTGTNVVLADDHPDGDTINATQTFSGTWGAGTITATTDVVINAGVVITVAPGTTILVADGVAFTVTGDLHSDGPITFTTATSPAVPGAWEGITYAPGSSGYLNAATIEYAEQGLTLNTANIITISNSIIWSSWTQDTQADFQSDILTNTDATTKPGSVLLEEADSLSVGGVPGWSHRRRLFIENNVADELPAGYSVRLTLDTATLVSQGQLQADGDDLRVVWDDGATPVELDRVAETAFNSPDTEIWFKTQAPIPGSGRDGNYYIYYGNPSAGAPPANRANVYALWDDFDGSALDSSLWNANGSVFLSGGQAHLAVGASIIGTTPYTYGVLEMRVRLSGDDDRVWWGWENNASPLGDDMVVFQEYPPSIRDFTGLTADGGPINRVPLPDPAGGLTTWHTYVADWWPGNARWLIDGTEEASTTVEVPDSGIYALFHARLVPMDVDWAKARLRVAQEPSVTLSTPQPGYASQGQVLSIAYDTSQSSDWKYLTWDSTTPPDTGISLRIRTAATQDGLGAAPWMGHSQSGLPVSNDAGRWVQYEATLTTTNPLTTPELHKVTVYYANLPVTLTVAPDPETIVAGEVVTYTASIDDGSNTRDVTAETDFSIEAGAGGSWADNTYTSEVAGDWTVTGAYADLSDTATLHVEPTAGLLVTKTSSAALTRVNNTLTYTVIVANNGPSMATGVTVTDTLPAGVTFVSATPSQGSGCSGTSTVTCPLGDLVNGATATVTIVITPTAAGTIVNTVEATGVDPLGNLASDSDTVSVDVINPAIEIAKMPDTQKVASGSSVTFTIVVTNTGDAPLSNVYVTDAQASACTQMIGALTAGDDYSYTCNVDNVTVDFTNSATVTGTPSVGADVSDTDTAFVDVLPTIAVSKTANPANIPEPGGTVTFTVRVDNTSQESVTLTSLVDDIHGDLNGQGTCSVPQAIPAGGHYECAFSATVSGSAGDRETDIVTAEGTDDDGNAVSNDDDATVSITEGYNPAPSIVKDGPATANVGERVVFTFTVGHAADSDGSPISNVSVSDDVAGTATYVSGDDDSDGLLEADETWVFTASHAIQPSAPNPLVNTATVTGQDKDGNPASATDTHSTDIEFNPVLDIVKDGPAAAEVGETVTFTFTVSHAGTSDYSRVSNVSVSDDVAGTATQVSGDTNRNGQLDAAETWVFTASYTIRDSDPNPLVNVATVTGQDKGSHPVSATDTHSTRIKGKPVSTPTIFLPLILRSPVTTAPDLVVERVTVTGNNVQVVIRNQGATPVLPADAFWVDLYVDPNPVPTGVNQTWDDGRCAEGSVWGVTAPALPLAPGGVIALTLDDAYYWPSLSNFSGALPVGTPIYVQVDSANTNTTYGAVLENHEITGAPYNNITGPVFSTLSAMGEEPGEAAQPITGDHTPASSQQLPPRP